MEMKRIREIARRKGIKPGVMKKGQIIRFIQQSEGNFDCFGTASGDCSQKNCIWRKDCLR